MTKTFEKDLEEVGYRYQSFFENSPVSLWEEDFSEVANYLDTLKAGGISDFSKYFNENPGELKACAQKVKVLDVNKAALALHGADSKEELLSNLDKTFTESSFDVFKEELSALAEGRTDFESEAEVKTLSGQPKNVHVKFSLMRTKKSGSDITRALVAITDITDRKRTEATLREREAQFRSVLAAAPDLMFVLDAKGRYRDIFTSTPDLLLVPRDQLLGKTIHEVMSPESAQPIQEGIDKTLLTGEPQRIDYSLEIGGVEKLFSARVVKFKFQGHDCVLWSARDITRQKEAEEASNKSHRKLIEAEQIAHMGFLDWNLKTNELVLSKEVYQLYGIDPETPVTPELLMNLLHPDDREPVITSLDLARQGISKHEMDHRVVRSDGSVIWLQARADLERDEEGVPISLLGTVVDITERKSIEEELTIKHEEIQRQYTELEQLYKHLPIGLCLVDSDLRYLRINKMLAEINGAPVDDHIGRTIREIIPQLADQVEQPYHRVLETAEPIVDMEVTGTTVAEPDTEKSWLASFYPIKSSSGKVCFVSTIVNDVTQRKKAEALLKDSEARFRMIYEHAPVMIDAFDSNGRCFMFNKECERVFGWTAEEIYAHENPLILFYPDPEIQRQVVETVTTEPEKVFREWKPRRKDGSETVCLWANFKLPDGLVINLGYDITERKKSEEDMRQLRSELLHTTRVLTMGELTAALAHELNHPLGSILNNANAVKKYLEHEEPNLNEIQDIIADIISEDRRASSVIKRLTDLLKKTEVEFSSLGINGIIEEVIGLVHSDLIIKNISFSKQLTKKLPEVKGDRVQLQQVFLNLIINATDSMKECREKNLHISTAKHGAESIIVCVRDSGSGFDPKEKDNLFDPFFTTKKEGMGMGLSIAKTIIKAHYGDILVENNKEGGASVFMTLPCI